MSLEYFDRVTLADQPNLDSGRKLSYSLRPMNPDETAAPQHMVAKSAQAGSSIATSSQRHGVGVEPRQSNWIRLLEVCEQLDQVTANVREKLTPVLVQTFPEDEKMLTEVAGPISPLEADVICRLQGLVSELQHLYQRIDV